MLKLSFTLFLKAIILFKTVKNIKNVIVSLPCFEKHKVVMFHGRLYLHNRYMISILYMPNACDFIELAPIHPNTGLDFEGVREFATIKEATAFIKLYAELPYQGIPLKGGK